MAGSTTIVDLPETLRRHGVKTAVVIDNAFDVRVTEAVSDEALRLFTEQIGQDDDAAAELRENGIDPEAVARRDEDTLLSLAGRLETLESARPYAETLLFDYLSERRPVDELLNHLRSLGLDAIPLGGQADIADDLEAQLAFIDYFLDETVPFGDLTDLAAPDHAENARQKARAVYERTRAYIVLMSSRPLVRRLEAEFRRQARLLKGFFRFETKEALSDREALCSCISMIPLEVGFRHTLHDFIDTLESRSSAIGERFMRDVRELGLEDYAHLRQLSLKDEGHPFGDYTVRLFGAYLTSLVLEDGNVMTLAARLDRTEFDAFLPLQDDPSSILGKIYLAALTERLWDPIEACVPSPTAPAQLEPEAEAPAGDGGAPSPDAPEGAQPVCCASPPADDACGPPGPASPPGAPDHEPGSERPEAVSSPEIGADAPQPPGAGQRPPDGGGLLREDTAQPLIQVDLGYLFVKDDSSPIYAVMNPACDLVIAAGRKREADDTLLLMPGRIRHLHESFAGDRTPTFFTPIYEYDGKIFRIDWDYRRVRTIRHCELRQALLELGYRCERRLQLGPALELQQHLTSAIGRVGLPVPPPLRQSADARIFCRRSPGEWVNVSEPIRGGVVILHTRDHDRFVLNAHGRAHLLEAVVEHTRELTAEAGGATWKGSPPREQYLRDLERAAKRWRSACPFFREPGDLPLGRTAEKTWSKRVIESRDRLAVARDAVALLKAQNIDVALILDLGPMELNYPGEDQIREMDEP